MKIQKVIGKMKKNAEIVPEYMVSELNNMICANDLSSLHLFLEKNPDLSVFKNFSGWDYSSSYIKDPLALTLKEDRLECFSLLMQHNFPFEITYIGYLDTIIASGLTKHMKLIYEDYRYLLCEDMRRKKTSDNEFLYLTHIINKSSYDSFYLDMNKWLFLKEIILANNKQVVENFFKNPAYLSSKKEMNVELIDNLLKDYQGDIKQLIKENYLNFFQMICMSESSVNFRYFVDTFSDVLKDLAIDNKNLLMSFIDHYSHENELVYSRAFGKESVFRKHMEYLLHSQKDDRIHLFLSKDKKGNMDIHKLLRDGSALILKILMKESLVDKHIFNDNQKVNKNEDTLAHIVFRNNSITDKDKLQIIEYFDLNIASVKNKENKNAYELSFSNSQEINVLYEKQRIHEVINLDNLISSKKVRSRI